MWWVSRAWPGFGVGVGGHTGSIPNDFLLHEGNKCTLYSVKQLMLPLPPKWKKRARRASRGREGILCKYPHAPFVICLARLEPRDALRRPFFFFFFGHFPFHNPKQIFCSLNNHVYLCRLPAKERVLFAFLFSKHDHSFKRLSLMKKWQ